MISIELRNFKPENQTSIVKRLSAIVANGVHAGIPYQKDNGSFVLDSANNWFLCFVTEGEVTTLRLTYRYENTKNVRGMQGLNDYLNWTLVNYIGT